VSNTSTKTKRFYANNHSDLEVNEEGVNFLPFLDVLFSTMGIFVIIIFLHEHLSSIPRTDLQKIDAVIVCLPNEKYEWFGADSDESVELDGIREIEIKVTTLAKALKSNPNLLVAFTKNGIRTQLSLKKLFNKLSKTATVKNEAERITIQPIWWPLNESDNSYSALVEQWYSSQTREEKSESQRDQ